MSLSPTMTPFNVILTHQGKETEKFKMKTGHAIPDVDQWGTFNPNGLNEGESPTYSGLELEA